MLETGPRHRSKVWDNILAEGEAEAVLIVLEARGVEVPEDARERIAGCQDLAQLKVWLQCVATISDIEELFD